MTTIATLSSLVRRCTVAMATAVLLATGLMVVGTERAYAGIVVYFPCPETVPGMGCGISGHVGPGNYTAEFTFVTAKGYDFEPFVDHCSTECPVFHWAIGRQDRTPAGYQIVSDSPFIVDRMLSK